MSESYDHMESPTKRRRLSRRAEEAPSYSLPSNTPSVRFNAPTTAEGVEATDTGKITMDATSKLAGQIVAPFLTKHIPDQYAHLGGMDTFGSPTVKASNTKYCYRHRPDLKCRRQANEPSMDQLQHVSDDLRTHYLDINGHHNRNSKCSLRLINKLLPMYGHCSLPHRPSSVISCFRAFLRSVASHSYPTSQPMYGSSSESISSAPCRQSCLSESSAFSIRLRCAKPHK